VKIGHLPNPDDSRYYHIQMVEEDQLMLVFASPNRGKTNYLVSGFQDCMFAFHSVALRRSRVNE
jgi:hypothetical protein